MMEEFSKHPSQTGFRSVWEHFESIIDPVIIQFLTEGPLHISKQDITEAPSKSVYPDLRIQFQGKKYAIDIKSGEDGRNPWYDMGRVDTYENSHLNVFEAEYYITVRWVGREPSKVIDVYIEPAHQSVGYKDTYQGILYRPYDGKIRPKPWSDFEQGSTHWRTKDEFLAGLEAAKIHRRMHYMAEWYAEMTKKQRDAIKLAFVAIENGQPLRLFASDE